MKVSELIEKLQQFNPEKEIGIVFDGADRMDVQCVWLSRNDRVLISDLGHTVYSTEDRPENAPTEKEQTYWQTDQVIPL